MKGYALFTLVFCGMSMFCNASEIMLKKITIGDIPDAWTRDFNVSFYDDRLALRNTTFYQDEEGQTHYTNLERIGQGIIAKKQFILKNPVYGDAEVFVFQASGLELSCNGNKLKTGKSFGTTGWYFWKIPGGILKKGLNEFVFSGNGTLLIEPSIYPNHSARSFNNGEEWDFNNLGINNGNGEYLVRLRVQQYPEQGTAVSNVYDLLSIADGRSIHGDFFTAEDLKLVYTGDIPDGTDISFRYRCGSTALYSPEKWGKWNNLKKKGNTWIIDEPLKKRFIQISVILKTNDSRKTPSLKQILISGKIKFSISPEYLNVVYIDKNDITTTSIPFAYQWPTYRTKAIRETYNLDNIIKKGNTELEKFVLLRDWARHTAVKGWDWGKSMWCPPWDALIILSTNKEPIALCMCTHYSTIFTQCAISLGFTARQVILNHHCVAEVWSDQFNKWILMDTGNSSDPELNCHFEHEGIPLNALEIRNLWKQDRTNEIQVVYSSGKKISGDEIKNQCDFSNYRRFAIPLRNNFLGNPFPGELEQGMSQYYCDLYLWWDDSQIPVESPEYGKTSNRISDFYWTLNKTIIDLVYQKDNILNVSLSTNAAVFSHYLISIDGGAWTKSKDNFKWNIHNGRNELRVKAVNSFGLECPVSKAIIDKTD